MGGSAAGASELEDAHRAIGVLARDLAIIRFAARAPESDRLIESVLSGGDAEADKHFVTSHFLGTFQVLDGFVDGVNQAARLGEVLLENLSMRVEGGNDFEIALTKDLFDLLQLEPQLPVKQNLLEGQQLRLLIEPVTIRSKIGGFQQLRFIIKMKCAHADARHPCHLLDGISHRVLSAEATLALGRL